MRTLNVSIEGQRVGVLGEGDGLWTFDYEPAWAQSPQAFDIAPGLPRERLQHADGGTNRPVQWFFDNLLPEEGLRDAVAKDARTDAQDAFALLQYLGAESAGALTLLPPGQPLPQDAALKPLPRDELSRRIQLLPTQTLVAGAPKRMSLAGAQHKLLVVLRNDQLYEPVGSTPSTHILKPSHPVKDAYPASVPNEYVTMRLARAAGLDVPQVHLLYLPEPAYVVDRFDRAVGHHAGKPPFGMPEAVRRLHIVDACQLLNRSRVFKHTNANLATLRQVIAATTNKQHTRQSLFRWLVFNAAIGNDDAHLKNLSFFVSSEGIRITPHYDLLATSAYSTPAFADERANWPDGPLAIPLPGAATFGQITRESLVAAARELGLGRNAAERTLDQVGKRLPMALRTEMAALEELHAAHDIDAAQRGAATRFLRVLEHILLKDMLPRLAP